MATKKKALQAAAGAVGAGEVGLYVEDVFSTYLYEGTGKYENVKNDINIGQSYGSGSVYHDNDAEEWVSGTLPSGGLGSGDFTIEMWVNQSNQSESNNTVFCTGTSGSDNASCQLAFNSSNGLTFWYSGLSSFNTSGATLYQNTWYHVAIVRSGSSIDIYVDGVNKGSTTDSTDLSTTSFKIGTNRGGGDKFGGWISNVRVVVGTAVYTSGFTPSTSELTAITNTELLCFQGSDPFTDNSSNALTLTQNNSPTAVTFGPFDAAEEGAGGMAWIKSRSSAASGRIIDTERGAGYRLIPSGTNGSAYESDTIYKFNADGYQLRNNGNTNYTGTDYVLWTFRKATGFFDIVTWTGTGSARTISHNLGCDVGTLIVKRLDSSDNWMIWHKSRSGEYGVFGSQAFQSAASAIWNSTDPTSTEFSVGTDPSVNNSGESYIAYLFADGDDADAQTFGTNGDEAIVKCGSYTGNGSSSGPEIDLGFEPQFLMVKDADAVNDWYMWDTMRGLPAFVSNSSVSLNANKTDAETREYGTAPLPNGFRVTDNNAAINTSGNTYIYIAIRRPHKPASEFTAADLFDVNTFTGNATADRDVVGTTDVLSDFVLFSDRDASSTSWGSYAQIFMTRLMGDSSLGSATSTAETQSWNNYYKWSGPTSSGGWGLYGTNSDSDYLNKSGTDYVAYRFQRSPGFFDVVCYEGDGVAGRTVNHNLGVVPEMMIVRRRDAGNYWRVYVSHLGATGALRLDGSNAFSTSDIFWDDTSPTASVFSVGDNAQVNTLYGKYVAYLFASQDGISKIGTYTGNGTSQTIDCGFSNGARFVLIKRTDNTNDWNYFDTGRGIVAGNDSRLSLNTFDAEGSGDYIDPDSSGFTINYVATGTSDSNISGATYIYLAIA